MEEKRDVQLRALHIFTFVSKRFSGADFLKMCLVVWALDHV